MATQAVGHVVPSRNLPVGHEEHWLVVAPVQVRQFEWQLSQVLVVVLANWLEGHVVMHVVPLRYLVPVHVRHWLLAAPEQVKHSEWQTSQVFVAVFSKTLVATQAVGHVVASRNLPTGQEMH